MLGFWLELGLSGFRVDAVPFLLRDHRPGPTPRPARPARLPRATCAPSSAGAAATPSCSARSTCPTPSSSEFFGGEDGDELNMLFDFIGMQPLYLSLARGDAGPLADALRVAARSSPPGRQWANFVRNHDELTLDKLTDGRAPGGVRRLRPRPGHAALRPRPAPPAAADARRRPAADPHGLQPAVLAARHAGAVLRRGDRHGREPRGRGPAGRAHADAVDGGPNGGFSTRRPRRPPAPWPTGAFGPEHVNVGAQRRDPDSLLSFMRLLIAATARARSSAGAGSRCSTSRTPRRCSPTARRGTTRQWSPCTTSPTGRSPPTLPLTGLGGCDLFDVLAADGSTVTVGDDGDARARRCRRTATAGCARRRDQTWPSGDAQAHAQSPPEQLPSRINHSCEEGRYSVGSRFTRPPCRRSPRDGGPPPRPRSS